MDVKAVVEAGGHGLDSVIDGVARLRSVLPEEARQLADSAVGTDVSAMLAAAGERADVAKVRAAETAEAARAKAVEAAHAARAKAAELAEASPDAARDRRSRLPFVLGAVAVTGAAAAAAVLVWRRRQAAAVEDLSGDTGWQQPEVVHTPSVADDQSPEAMDPHFAEEVDEVADEIAEDFIEAVEGEADVARAQQPAEPFVPGVADEQSPDVVDETFATEVDAVADEIAEDFVERIEESGKHTP